MFGDLGADNPKALPRLRRDTQQGMYDAVLHVGEASAGASGRMVVSAHVEGWCGERRWGAVPGPWRGQGWGQCVSEGTGDETGYGDGVCGQPACLG